MAYSSFEELEVWRRSCDLTVRIYDELKSCRDYGLRDQMTRAAVSIASNIAEGAERDSREGQRPNGPNCGRTEADLQHDSRIDKIHKTHVLNYLKLKT